MYQKIIIPLLLSLAGSTSYGDSIDPCTATEVRRPIAISCTQTETGSTEITYYHINIERKTSPNIPQCQGENRIVRETATISITPGEDNVPEAHILLHKSGLFEFSLSDPAYFKSEAYGIELTNCLVPQIGATSFGN